VPHSGTPLHKSGPIRQCGVDVDRIEPPCHNRNNEHNCGQQDGEPESRFPHRSGKCANVFSRNNKVVEEGEDKVEDEASPDCDVIENCPVGGV